MPKPPLLLDEMLGTQLAEHLRASGWDVLAIVENKELTGTSDLSVLNLAATSNRIVVTLNVGDFARLHSQFMTSGATHSGIWCVSARNYMFAKDPHIEIAITIQQSQPPVANEIKFL